MTDSSGNGHHGSYDGVEATNRHAGAPIGEPNWSNSFGQHSCCTVLVAWISSTGGNQSDFIFGDAFGNDQRPSSARPRPPTGGSAVAQSIVASYHGNNGRAYQFALDSSDRLYLAFYTATAGTSQIGRRFNTALALNTWHHVVGSYDGSKSSNGIRLYLNGIRVDDTDINQGVYAGMDLNWSNPTVGGGWSPAEIFNGRLDEVAIYPSVLSPARVLAHVGARVTVCQAASGLASGAWSTIAGGYDGTDIKLYVDGQLECTVALGAYSAPTQALLVGGSPGGLRSFKGAFEDLKIYTSFTAGTAAGYDALMRPRLTNPAVAAGIVSSTLVYDLDADAASGSQAYASGCAAGTLSWLDLASLGGNPLVGFSGCGGSSGWKGAGSAADPHRLAFDGTNDHVPLPDSILRGQDPQSIELWFRTTQGGVLLGVQDVAYWAAPSSWVPLVMVSTVGDLRAGYYTGQNQIATGRGERRRLAPRGFHLERKRLEPLPRRRPHRRQRGLPSLDGHGEDDPRRRPLAGLGLGRGRTLSFRRRHRGSQDLLQGARRLGDRPEL